MYIFIFLDSIYFLFYSVIFYSLFVNYKKWLSKCKNLKFNKANTKNYSQSQDVLYSIRFYETSHEISVIRNGAKTTCYWNNWQRRSDRVYNKRVRKDSYFIIEIKINGKRCCICCICCIFLYFTIKNIKIDGVFCIM